MTQICHKKRRQNISFKRKLWSTSIQNKTNFDKKKHNCELFFAQIRQKLTQICTKMNRGHNQHFVFALDSDFDLTFHLESVAYDKK